MDYQNSNNGEIKLIISEELINQCSGPISYDLKFIVNINGAYDTLLMFYKDKPGMISQVSDIIQKHNINIATLHCGRSSKGGIASMCIELDIPASEIIVNTIKELKDVFFVTNIRKLK